MAFLLAVPAAYLISGHGLIALVVLVIISRTAGRVIGMRFAKRAAVPGPTRAEPISIQPAPPVNLAPQDHHRR